MCNVSLIGSKRWLSGWAYGAVCRTTVHTVGSTRALQDDAIVNRYAKEGMRDRAVAVWSVGDECHARESGKRSIVESAGRIPGPLPPALAPGPSLSTSGIKSTWTSPPNWLPGTRRRRAPHTHMTQPRSLEGTSTSLHRARSPNSTPAIPPSVSSELCSHLAPLSRLLPSRKRVSQHEPKTAPDVLQCGTGASAPAGVLHSSCKPMSLHDRSHSTRHQRRQRTSRLLPR